MSCDLSFDHARTHNIESEYFLEVGQTRFSMTSVLYYQTRAHSMSFCLCSWQVHQVASVARHKHCRPCTLTALNFLEAMLRAVKTLAELGGSKTTMHEAKSLLRRQASQTFWLEAHNPWWAMIVYSPMHSTPHPCAVQSIRIVRTYAPKHSSTVAHPLCKLYLFHT